MGPVPDGAVVFLRPSTDGTAPWLLFPSAGVQPADCLDLTHSAAALYTPAVPHIGSASPGDVT